jgi:hypothetical protein
VNKTSLRLGNLATAAAVLMVLSACGGGGTSDDLTTGGGTPVPVGCVALATTNISTAVTLATGCYNIDSTLNVRNGGALTLNAGTTLRFASATQLYVEQGGSLTTLGTAAAPVTLTGQDQTAGFWQGVRFVFSNSSLNSLTHTIVEYGGGNAGANLSTLGLSTSPARLKLNNVTLRNSNQAGFVFDTQTLLDTVTNLKVTDNAFPGTLPANLVAQLGTTSSFSGNTENTLHVKSQSISQAQTWPLLDVPYRLIDQSANYSVDAPLTLAPGVKLVMAAGSTLYVSQSGALKAAGTAALPITFTGEQATAGYWKGIEFVFSNNVNNELSQAVVEYAGGSSRGAAVSLLSLSTSPSRVKMANLTLRNSSSGGFGFDSLALVDQFSAVTSTLNAFAGYSSANGASVLGGDSSYTGNTQNHVRLDNPLAIGRAQTWHALNVPYLLPNGGNYNVDAALTIEAGTQLIMASGSALYVSQTGSLSAVGTAAAPIRMRGAQATPGYWKGVQFIFSNSTANVMDHTEITDAGAGSPSNSGAIYMLSLSTAPARLALSNSAISNSASWGVFRDELSVFTASGNTFTNNVSGGVNR